MDYQKTLNSFDFQTNQEPTIEESRTATELGIKSPEMPTLNEKTISEIKAERDGVQVAQIPWGALLGIWKGYSQAVKYGPTPGFDPNAEFDMRRFNNNRGPHQINSTLSPETYNNAGQNHNSACNSITPNGYILQELTSQTVRDGSILGCTFRNTR